MGHLPRHHGLCAALMLSAFCPAIAAAESLSEPLTADDLLLVYNASVPESRELAAYYAQVRGVPQGRLCELHLGRAAEEISADAYERHIRRPVRAFLHEHQLEGKVRCLVIFYGVPIRVSQEKPTFQDRREADALEPELKTALQDFEAVVQRLEGIGRPGSRPAEPRPAGPPGDKDLEQLLQRYTAAMKTAIPQVATSPGSKADLFLELIEKAEGQAGLAGRLTPQGMPKEVWLKQAQAELIEADKAARILLRADASSRREGRKRIQQLYGLSGLARELRDEIRTLRVEESAAAVDSELMLVLWEKYPKSRWLVSSLCWRVTVDPPMQSRLPQGWLQNRMLMVSRLDGPNPATVRRMIDDAVAAEETPATGTVYLDARGLARDPSPGQFGFFDASLRDLASLLQAASGLAVRLEDGPQLFAPGDCPNTVLYCGWYSLRKYIDAFTFVRGAVAWHIASFEAASLKRPDEGGWCKNLLQRGAAATLGPVAEPYLFSFPRPKDFFGLLLTGRFTLAECFAYTSPCASWMQMLLGDPLYRPFRRNPHLQLEQVFTPSEMPEAFRAGTATKPASNPSLR